MPNIKSAWKRMRKSQTARAKNRSEKAAVNTVQAAFEAAGEESRMRLFLRYCSLLDKAVKKGVLTKNTASRRKSRASRRLARVAAGASPGV